MSQHEQKPREVPWIERIARWVPGYGGYMERSGRSSADQALREFVADRLISAKKALEETIRDMVSDGQLNKVEPLDRINRHLEKIASRIRAAGAGTSAFYGSSRLDDQKADSLHAFDFDLLDRTENLCRHVEQPDHDGDWLPNLEAALKELDARLDERVRILQGIR